MLYFATRVRDRPLDTHRGISDAGTVLIGPLAGSGNFGVCVCVRVCVAYVILCMFWLFIPSCYLRYAEQKAFIVVLSTPAY